MKKYRIILAYMVLSLSFESFCLTGDFSKDVSKTSHLLLKASLEQFKTRNNLLYAGVAAPSLWFSFTEDKRIIDNAMTKEIPKYMDLAGDFGIVLSFPVIPLVSYYLGRTNHNSKLMNFSMEYTASLYLTLLETGIMSHIPIHDRPNTQNLTFWEKSFRGKSSFVSGHIVPYAILFFKTLQFYGPYYASAPLLLTVLASLQRVREGRHYLSDVVGAFFLSAFSSEGVRAVAGHKNNHPFYKMIFEHNAQIGIVRYKGTYGPRLSFEF